MGHEMAAYETRLRAQGYRSVAGVDEAGRGPLAGPVVVAAVILPESAGFPGLTDSKQLTERQRESFYEAILEGARAVTVVDASHESIDRWNIRQATLWAMREAICRLEPAADYALIDGKDTLRMDIPSQSIIKGDRRVLSIAAASVVAKVSRDRLMGDYHRQFPEYGFDRHKGYPTKAHYAALRLHGPSPIHRRTFRLYRDGE